MDKDLLHQRFIEIERNIRDLHDDVKELFKEDVRIENEIYEEIEEVKIDIQATISAVEKDLLYQIGQLKIRLDALEKIHE